MAILKSTFKGHTEVKEREKGKNKNENWFGVTVDKSVSSRVPSLEFIFMG